MTTSAQSQGFNTFQFIADELSRQIAAASVEIAALKAELARRDYEQSQLLASQEESSTS